LPRSTPYKTNHAKSYRPIFIYFISTVRLYRSFRIQANKNPGSIRVLLSNPRWERRLLLFLELSGVGRVVEDGTDEDQERAEKMDWWIVWEAEGRMEA